MGFRALVVALALPAASCLAPAPPTDTEMASLLESHREAFESVTLIVAEKPFIERVEFDRDLFGNVRVRTTPVISDDRLDILRRFSDATGVEVITSGPTDRGATVVEFACFRSGILGDGVLKGIAFVPDPLFIQESSGALVSDDGLDSIDTRVYGSAITYYSIGQDWYLFLAT